MNYLLFLAYASDKPTLKDDHTMNDLSTTLQVLNIWWKGVGSRSRQLLTKNKCVEQKHRTATTLKVEIANQENALSWCLFGNILINRNYFKNVVFDFRCEWSYSFLYRQQNNKIVASGKEQKCEYSKHAGKIEQQTPTVSCHRHYLVKNISATCWAE